MLKHRTLLKSIIDNTGDKKTLEYVNENYVILKKSGIKFSLDSHGKIFQFICTHTDRYIDVPSIARISKKFEEDSEVIEELDKVKEDSALYASNFRGIVDEVSDDQSKKDLVELLKETNEISQNGVKVKRDLIKGPKKAVEHFLHKSMDFLKTASSIVTHDSLKKSCGTAVDDYFENKNGNKFDGLLTGLPSIDLVCKGIRRPEFWIIAAFVSELKTTMTMNFAYTQCVEQGKRVKFITLEMPYAQVRDLFVCIHSANLNLWPGSEWDDVYPLNYDDIVDGNLNDRQEDFFSFLCKDLEENEDYGDVDIYQPEDGLSVAHMKAWAEVEYRKEPFDIVYLDYIELMKGDGKGNDYTIELNQRIKDLKQFCIRFNDGKGMRLVSAYQTNRKGKGEADKCDGEYRLDALSYANEAERSADVIIYSYLNEELRENNQNKIGCLKNRSRPKFKQFRAKTNLSCRKIYETPDPDEITELDNLQKNKNSNMQKDDLINDMV